MRGRFNVMGGVWEEVCNINNNERVTTHLWPASTTSNATQHYWGDRLTDIQLMPTARQAWLVTSDLKPP